MEAKHWLRRGSASVIILLGCGSPDTKQESPPEVHVERTEESLAVPHDKTLWPAGTTAIPVCWINTGFDTEKRRIVQVLRDTWESYANISFAGFGACPTTGTAQFIRVWLVANPTPNDQGGGSAGIGPTAVSGSNGTASVHIVVPSNGSIDRLRYLAVHEFGHTLGFYHEQDRPDNLDPANNGTRGDCNPVGDIPASLYVTAYDSRSIMNYCNPGNNSYGWLSNKDKQGIAAAYGPRVSPRPPSTYLAADTTGYGREDLLYVWAGGVNTVYSNGVGFSNMSWEPAMPRVDYNIDAAHTLWFAGDANGDDRADLRHVWPGGINTLLWDLIQRKYTVLTEGWKPRADYEMNVDTTTWLSGDRNNDGRADLIHITPNGINTLLANSTNDGSYTLVAEAWKPRADYSINATTTHWLSGDVNGDGRADLVHLWSGGINTLLASGDGSYPLKQEAWKPRANYAMDVDTTRWLLANVNHDGRADLVHIRAGKIDTLKSNETNSGTYTLETEGWDPQPKFDMD